MTYVTRGYCPECGKPEFFGGVQIYHDTGQRVVACLCGSRRKPVEQEPIAPPQPHYSIFKARLH